MASTATSIEWTDATWNPVTGCSKVSPGCAHCYAERLAPKVFAGQIVTVATADGFDLERRKREFTDVRTHKDRLDQPLRWQKPRRIFVNSMSDLFHEDVPDAFIDRVFAVMALARRHTFQILTKRADRMRKYFDGIGIRQELIGIEAERISGFDRYDVSGIGARWKLPLPNVWLGVSVENQHFADERIPLLLKTPAAVRFISAEPLLEPVNLKDAIERGLWDVANSGKIPPKPAIDWVIVGGESGPGARPMDLAWARVIVQQCKSASVPCFVKQLGARPFGLSHRPDHGSLVLRDRKGGDPSEWPENLRIRQFPEAAG
jgi:protein gp37